MAILLPIYKAITVTSSKTGDGHLAVTLSRHGKLPWESLQKGVKHVMGAMTKKVTMETMSWHRWQKGPPKECLQGCTVLHNAESL